MVREGVDESLMWGKGDVSRYSKCGSANLLFVRCVNTPH